MQYLSFNALSQKFHEQTPNSFGLSYLITDRSKSKKIYIFWVNFNNHDDIIYWDVNTFLFLNIIMINLMALVKISSEVRKFSKKVETFGPKWKEAVGKDKIQIKSIFKRIFLNAFIHFCPYGNILTLYVCDSHAKRVCHLRCWICTSKKGDQLLFLNSAGPIPLHYEERSWIVFKFLTFFKKIDEFLKINHEGKG